MKSFDFIEKIVRIRDEGGLEKFENIPGSELSE